MSVIHNTCQTFALTLGANNHIVELHAGFGAAERALANRRSLTSKHIDFRHEVIIMGLEIELPSRGNRATFQVLCFMPVMGGFEGHWAPVRDRRLARRTFRVFMQAFESQFDLWLHRGFKWEHSI